MSHFSTQLTASIQRAGHSRQSFADASGVAYGSLTHYALDRRQATTAAVAAICRALPPDEAAAVLVARLRDELPAEHSALIRLEPRRANSTAEDPAPYGVDLPTDLRDAFDALQHAAVHHREWRDFILDLAAVADERPKKSKPTNPTMAADTIQAGLSAELVQTLEDRTAGPSANPPKPALASTPPTPPAPKPTERR